MAGRIRQEDVDAVRERADIVKVISGHLQLRKSGADRLVGLCPFHPEKTASFGVSPSKQAYYCFGCGEGGNVFTFLRKVENLSFAEAVEKLASEVGITLRYEGTSQSERRAAGRRQAVHKAIADAAGLYRRTLLEAREAQEARDYVGQRGISPDSVERFEIGYAPTYPDFLLRRLSSTYSAELLVEAGLVAKDAEGNLRDRFRGRVMFPIHDLSGHAVGFGGRLLAGPRAPANAPKYLNSPESAVYHKGSLLYNLSRARGVITRSDRAFLVEGYTDVVALDQAGVPEALATCGTALGEEHIRLLSRFAPSIVLAFDSDDAGARAAERAFAFHERYAVDLRVLVLPEGQDPADFVLAHGDRAGEAFAEALAGAVPLVEYMIGRALVGRDLATHEAKARASHDLVESILGKLQDPVIRERYAAVVAAKTGASENAVLLDLQRLGSPEGGAASPVPIRAGQRMGPGQKVEREALKLLVQWPELCSEWLPGLGPDAFSTPTHQRVFELLRDSSGASPADLMDRATDRGEHVHKLMAALAVEPVESGGAPTVDYAQQVFIRLEEFALSRRIDAIRKQLERLNPMTAQVEYDGLFEQLVALEGARRRLRMSSEAVGMGGPPPPVPVAAGSEENRPSGGQVPDSLGH